MRVSVVQVKWAFHHRLLMFATLQMSKSTIEIESLFALVLALLTVQVAIFLQVLLSPDFCLLAG